MEQGFTKEQLEFLVANNHSFYRLVMPEEWKKEFLLWAKENIQLIESASQDEEEVQLFLIEVMTEIAPCFVEVVTYDRRSWLNNEFKEILSDIRHE